MYRDIWTWEKNSRKIQSLRGRLGFSDSTELRFLKLALSLETGRIFDEIRNKLYPEITPNVYCILSGYAESKPTPETHKPISFSQLPGGQNYNNAFIRRAVQSIEKTFGPNSEELWNAAKLFDAERITLGDCSIRIRALPLVPITIIMHEKSIEFPASANMLFDASVINYLSTEQVAMLGELASARLRTAYEAIT